MDTSRHVLSAAESVRLSSADTARRRTPSDWALALAPPAHVANARPASRCFSRRSSWAVARRCSAISRIELKARLSEPPLSVRSAARIRPIAYACASL